MGGEKNHRRRRAERVIGYVNLGKLLLVGQRKKKRHINEGCRTDSTKRSEMGELIQPASNRTFDKLCSTEILRKSFKEVRKNKGAPGIDNVTIEFYESNLEENIKQLSQELKSWIYEPKPVRRVEIPKPNGGIRMLGIPCVKDRIVHAAIKILIESKLDYTFSQSSYAFRPGKNQRQAVYRAQEIVKKGKVYVVDIDISKFFDRIHHDRLIGRLRTLGIGKEILRLIGKTLRSGIMNNGISTVSVTGTPQGSPLSPLLSNVVLDELDKELEKRGLEFCRFADDCNIYVRTYKAANRVMESVSKFIKEKLKLEINKEKSKVDFARRTKFLGMIITAVSIMISPTSINTAMTKVKTLIPRRTHLSLEESMNRTNRWYMGWSGYYRMTQQPRQLHKIEAHIRRRFRARIVAQQKQRRNLVKKLIKNGISKRSAYKVSYSNKGTWAISHTRAVEKAFPNKWFIEEIGQRIRSNEKHSHWTTI